MNGKMNPTFQKFLQQKTGATAFETVEVIQELWSGYGQILRLALRGATTERGVIKHVRLPDVNRHPRGWNTDLGHRRKVKSYEVESTWYERYAEVCQSRVPNCLGVAREGSEVFLILEDLDAAGYSLRKGSVEWTDVAAGLQWLAGFHASYLGQAPDGLWPTGTYWHLATRPQELAALRDPVLKNAAAAIDARLNACVHQTFVHGDAKLANFCFAPNGAVAGVDFQYTGGGCGMKDVAYFIGSCLPERECERLEAQILDTYFAHLQAALPAPNPALETEWRTLYRVCWSDFHRFLKGWSPGHWKINGYSERITRAVIQQLGV